jgi:2-hydroxychromene-2-carboxylate isomerase
MSDQLETVKLYYDYKSPFTYLAMAPAYDLERTHRIRLRFIPFELDIRGVFGGDLDQRPEASWRKVRYLYLDARRYANARGLIIRGPQKIFDSRMSLISGTYADRAGKFQPYSDRVFERFFKRELNIEDQAAIGSVLEEVGLQAASFGQYLDTEGWQDLARARDAAEHDRVFGVPTFIVDEEPFWGNDRIEWVVKKLDRMDLRRPTPLTVTGSIR